MGYRDEQSLVFRDETKKVVRKAKAARTLNKSSSSVVIRPNEGAHLAEKSTIAADVAPDLPYNTRNHIIFQNPSIPLHEHGTSFYFHEFSNRAEFLLAVYKGVSLENPLVDVIKSIGMAAIANKLKSPEIMFAASEKQTSVLRAINLSLQNREEARTDSTMLTILLLGTFEVNAWLCSCSFDELTNEQLVTGTSLKSLDSWTSHVMGATALAKLRGKKQLETENGRRLFDLLRAHVVGCFSCHHKLESSDCIVVAWMSTKRRGRTSNDSRLDQHHAGIRICG